MNKDIKKKDKLLHITLKGLDQKNPYNLHEWLKAHRSEAYKEIIELEEEIDKNFADNSELEELKELLRAYWIVHVKAISEFKTCGQ